VKIQPQWVVTPGKQQQRQPIGLMMVIIINVCVKNAYTEIHEDPTNGLVADTRTQTKGCGLHIRLD
jgi:hypothetical protein